MDIYATSQYGAGDDIFFAVVGDISVVTVSGGSVGVLDPTPFDTQIYGDDAQAHNMCSAPLDGVWGVIASIVQPIFGTGVYIDEISWILESGTTEAEIILISTQDLVHFSTLSTIVVPEPGTVLLLALGMIGIRVNKRKPFL